MSKHQSDTGIVTLGAVTFFIIFFLIGYYQGFDVGKANQAEIAAKEHHENTKQQIRKSCIETDLVNLSRCVEKAIQTSGEYQRAERDLTAQQNMATYAKWLLGITTLMSAVTVLGIWFVKKTLDETRRAVKAAEDTVGITRRIGEAQVRGYVADYTPQNVIKGEPLPNLYFLAVDQARFFVTIKNVGQTPLIVASLEAGFSIGSAKAECFVSQGIDEGFNKFYLAPNNIMQKHVIIPRDDISNTWIWVLLKYVDIHEKKWIYRSVVRLIPTVLPEHGEIGKAAFVNSSPEPGMCVWKEDIGH